MLSHQFISLQKNVSVIDFQRILAILDSALLENKEDQERVKEFLDLYKKEENVDRLKELYDSESPRYMKIYAAQIQKIAEHFGDDSVLKAANKVRPKDVYQGPFLQLFSQSILTKDLKEKGRYQGLKKINDKYNGLCELLCNFFTYYNLLASNKESFEKLSQDEKDLLTDLENNFSKSHALERASLVQYLQATLFFVFPNSILSDRDNKKLISNGKINVALLEKSLVDAKDEHYIKFNLFKKYGPFITKGHTMLIYKNGNKFVFYDPNFGITKAMRQDEIVCYLENHSSLLCSQYGFNTACFIDNSSFIKAVIKHKEKITLNLDEDGGEKTPLLSNKKM